MKNILLLSLLTIPLLSAAQTWQWAVTAGGPGEDCQFDASVATSSAGYSYVTGYFTGTAQFGPFSLTAFGMQDIFVAKYSPAGECLWAVRAGATGNDHGRAIALDDAGFVYVTGYFGGNANFGGIMIQSSGGGDIFTAKYNPTDGSCLWVRKGGGGNSSTTEETGFGIDTDPQGNVYVTGVYSGTANFSGTFLTLGGPFIAKYDTDGTLIWAAQATNGSLNSPGTAIVFDPAGAVYITGFYYGVNFTFGTTGPYNWLGNADIFLAKADAQTGEWLWARSVGAGSQTDTPRALALDANGNVYVAGGYMASGIFAGNPGIPSQPFSSSNSFLVKYNTAGDFQWVRTVPQSGGNGSAHGLVYSPGTGTIVMTGNFGGTATFGPGVTLAATAPVNAYVARYTADGTCIWATAALGTSPLAAYGISTDVVENLYVSGYFSGAATFGPATANTAGAQDFFLARMGTGYCPPSSATLTLEACDSLVLNGQTYLSSGTYLQTLTNTLGCDSLLTVNFTLQGQTDDCGLCIPDGEANPLWNQSCTDCAGVPFGFATLDNCGTCVGGTTGLAPCEPQCQSDFNGDGVISYGDLLQLLSENGCTAGCLYDLNNDGIVGFSDLILLMSSFGFICP